MDLLGLLSDFAQPFLDLVPRVARRPASNEYKVCDSPFFGVHETRWPTLYCPAFTYVEFIPKYEYPIDCGIQKLTDLDGRAFIVNSTVRVKIIFPISLRETLSMESWADSFAMEVRSIVRQAFESEVMPTEGEIFGAISDMSLKMGIELVRFQVEDKQQVLPISIT